MPAKLNKILKKSYMFIAICAILFVLLLINYFHIKNNGIIKNVAIILLGVAILYVLNKFVINKLKDKTLKKCIIILLIIFAILEILSVIFFRVEYNWDFKWLMESSKDIATTGTTENTFYFKIFPNNWGALIITTLSMKLAFGSEVGAYAINIIFILLSAIFAVLSAKKIGGYKLAINVLILLIGCAPLYLYSPIVYTDTLSVAFPIATLYFWLSAKENVEKSHKKSIIYTVIMAIVGAIGYCIKPVAGIILVAIAIDLFCTHLNKDTLKKLAIIVVTALIIITAFNKFCENVIIKDSKKNDLEFPLTHWVMMGLSTPEIEGGTSIGYGAYSQEDADYTSTSGNYEQKKQANIEKIKERLKNFGITGYIDFLAKKFKYVWNDGSYYAISVIGWDTINKTSLPYKIVIDKQTNGLFKEYMTGFNNYMFFVIFIGIIIGIAKKDINQTKRILGISIVGIALFLLVWEARSRYIYFLIPIFCLYAGYESLQVFDILNNKIKKRSKSI